MISIKSVHHGVIIGASLPVFAIVKRATLILKGFKMTSSSAQKKAIEICFPDFFYDASASINWNRLF
ncbi:hypothetical protein [Thalassomonas actiniarum]|uniref:Uncharacterized protein n=1 Tax=Thalassomonas actiniarum TaxID=485447 RepID=A0AAE9YPU5_9GAMM|nr:hypothetical protein [Thalassomonas actiniarum]WDD99064.1 hypothetical protein SG35_028255 [Thalassomonas actiniarum]